MRMRSGCQLQHCNLNLNATADACARLSTLIIDLHTMSALHHSKLSTAHPVQAWHGLEAPLLPTRRKANCPVITASYLEKHSGTASSCTVPRSLVVCKGIRPTVFFLESDSSEGFKLPLEPQQLLGLKAGQQPKDSDVNSAYDDLLNTAPEPGYSSQMVASRSELLETVRNLVLSNKGRTLDKRDKQVIVPFDLLPACLALLSELCENDMVMFLGTELLATGELDDYPIVKADVLLAMANAKCNMARDAFATSPEVAGGCKHLEDALALLQPKGSAPVSTEMVHEIKTSLAQLHSQAAMEQVSKPLAREYADERKKAVRTIRELLKQASDNTGDASATKTAGAKSTAPISRDYVARLMGQLTVDEVVFLQEWEQISRNASKYPWVYPGLLEHVAWAHILLGYLQCQPAYIKMASQLLKLQTPATPDLLVAQAVCQILLGAVQQSVELLRQAESLATKADVRTSPDVVGIPANPLQASKAYQYIKDHTPSGEDGLLPGLCQYTEQWLAYVAMPQFRDTATDTPQASLTKYFNNTHVEALIEVYDEKSEQAALRGVLTGLQQRVSQVKQVAASSLSAAAGSVSGVQERLQDLPAISNLTVSQQTASRAAPIAIGAVLGLAALGFLLFPRKQHVQQPTPTVPSTASLASARDNNAPKQRTISDNAAVLDARTAESVLRLWQDVKGAALGPHYDAANLGSVLAEPVLGDMKAKVAKFQAEGWYMKYKLHKMKVHDLEYHAPSGGHKQGYTRVMATLDESATLFDKAGKQADAYTSTYEAQYDIIKGSDATWKLSKVVVITPEHNA